MNLTCLEYFKIRMEILKIYNKLFDCSDNYDDIMDLYIKYLQLNIRLESKPIYVPCPDGFKYGNCYTYAMGMKCPKDFWELCKRLGKIIPFNVGFVSDSKHGITDTSDEHRLLEHFYEDCEFLKIRVYDGAKLPMHGGYRIFLYIDKLMEKGESEDYHFVRENRGGILSHKNGYNGDIEQLGSLSEVNSDYKLVRTLEIVR